MLAIKRTIRESSKERLYQESGLEPLEIKTMVSEILLFV